MSVVGVLSKHLKS